MDRLIIKVLLFSTVLLVGCQVTSDEESESEENRTYQEVEESDEHHNAEEEVSLEEAFEEGELDSILYDFQQQYLSSRSENLYHDDISDISDTYFFISSYGSNEVGETIVSYDFNGEESVDMIILIGEEEEGQVLDSASFTYRREHQVINEIEETVEGYTIHTEEGSIEFERHGQGQFRDIENNLYDFYDLGYEEVFEFYEENDHFS